MMNLPEVRGMSGLEFEHSIRGVPCESLGDLAEPIVEAERRHKWEVCGRVRIPQTIFFFFFFFFCRLLSVFSSAATFSGGGLPQKYPSTAEIL